MRIRTLVAIVLSAILAVGGVPAPALAEMGEESVAAAAPARSAAPAEPLRSGAELGEEPAVPAEKPAAPAEEQEGVLGEQPIGRSAANAANADNAGAPSDAAGQAGAAESEAPVLSAQADAVASGTWGTCPWEISSDGTLTIRPGNGSPTGAFEAGVTYMPPWHSKSKSFSIKKVKFEGSGASKVRLPTQSGFLFAYLTTVESMDLSGADTSAVENMECMFLYCSSLTSLDLSGWDTSSVKNMHSVFSYCSSLKSLSIADWDASSVTTMGSMFYHCSSLESLDLSRWDTPSVTSTNSMFSGCSSLKSLDISGLDTSSVRDSEGMFSDCLPDTISIGEKYEMHDHSMFPYEAGYMWNSQSLDFPFGSSDIVEFGGCVKDTYVRQEAYEFWESSWGTCPWVLYGDGTLVVSPGEGGEEPPVNEDEEYVSPWAGYADRIRRIVFRGSGGDRVRMPANCNSLFAGLGRATHIDVGNADFSRVNDMSFMFEGCSSVGSLNLMTKVTSSVEYMPYMFAGCSSLKSLDASVWDTSNVGDMEGMFSGCSSLESLDLSRWDTSNVGDMEGMFSGCSPETIKVGANYVMKGADMFPQPADGHKWRSDAAGGLYESAEVAARRSGIADTYRQVSTTSPVDISTASGYILPVDYTGQAIVPNPTLTMVGGVSLREGTDYRLEYDGDTTNAGKVRVVAVGIGAFTGEKELWLVIRKARSTIGLEPQSKAYAGGALAYSGRVARTGSSGAVSFAYYSDAACTRAVAAGDVKDVGTYYVRATLAADANHKEATSAPVEFRVTPAQITSVAVSPASFTYDGSAKTPALTVRAGSLAVPASGYAVSYANNVNAGTARVTVTGRGNFAGTASARFEIKAPAAPKAARVSYQTHVQNIGDQGWRRDGVEAGTHGMSYRLEAIRIRLEGAHVPGSIEYRTHVQNIGWQDYRRDGAEAGTHGLSYRLEAIQIRLTGEMARYYDVWYCVHAQDIGDMGWAKNDAPAGTAGFSRRLEAIRIVVLPKGSPAPGRMHEAFVSADGSTPAQSLSGHAVRSRTHVQDLGWQGWATDGQMSGTQGMSKRLEGIEVALCDRPSAGSIEYRTHVQNIGWQGYVKDGQMSGTSGRSLRLEAIQLRLTGAMGLTHDVWYRVHAENFGWMGWAKNDQQAGTAGFAYRLEGIEILVLPKGTAAPGPTGGAFRQR